VRSHLPLQWRDAHSARDTLNDDVPVSSSSAAMVKGGGDADVAALLAHIASVPHASVQRMAARGLVQLLTDQRQEKALQSPLIALRGCLVGAPAAAVDEVRAVRLESSCDPYSLKGAWFQPLHTLHNLPYLPYMPSYPRISWFSTLAGFTLNFVALR
jgi:hypothetical protein